MRRRRVDDPAPAARLHARQGGADGVEGGGEIDGDDGVPLVDRELVDGRDMLDAGVVHQNVDRAVGLSGLGHHLGDLVGQVFAMLILTVAAAEAAIGLAILVVYFRNRGSIAVEDINMMKG